MWVLPGNSITTIAIASCVITFLVLARVIRTFGLVSAPAVYATLFAFFHFGTVFGVYVFGLPLPLIGAGFLDKRGLGMAIILSVFGLLAFAVGTEFYTERSSRKALRGLPVSRAQGFTGRDRDIFNLAIFVLALVAIAYILVGIQSGVLIAGKSALVAARATGGTQYNSFGVISDLLSIASFIAVAYAPRRYYFWVAAVPLLLDFPIFISGQRGKFIVTLAALAIIAKKKGIRIPLPVAVSAIPIGMLVASTLRHFTKLGSNSFGSNWFLNGLYEMGQQIQVVTMTMHAIQAHLTNYWFGTSYLWAFWQIIPNVGNLRGVFPQADPGIWLTQLYEGVIGTAGLGFSPVAEGYLNFGWPGTFILLGVIGFFLARFERFGTYSFKILAVYGAGLGGVFFAIRNSMTGVIRPIVWSIILIWILKQAAVIVRERFGTVKMNKTTSELRKETSRSHEN